MVPMNLLDAGAIADYIDCGSWADKAIKEVRKAGTVNVAASTKNENYSRLPRPSELRLTPGAAYVHVTSNNTIEGTQYKTLPETGTCRSSTTHRPTCSAARSTSAARPHLAGAQKNMGPAGLTIVIVRDDLVERSAAKKATLPTMLNYAVHAETARCTTRRRLRRLRVGLVMKWLLQQGGLTAMAAFNERKAAKLYAEIDRTGFYRGTAAKEDRR